MSLPTLEAFLAQYPNICRVAFIGGSHAAYLAEISLWIREILTSFSPDNLLVITGGTADGVPGAATAIAHDLGFSVLGVMPECGITHAAPLFGMHQEKRRHYLLSVPPIIPPSTWGDESPLLMRLAEIVVVFGGEWGTAVEIATALKANGTKLRREQRGEPASTRAYTCIIPIAQFPGPAQHALAAPWLLPELRAVTFRFESPASPAAVIDAITDTIGVAR